MKRKEWMLVAELVNNTRIFVYANVTGKKPERSGELPLISDKRGLISLLSSLNTDAESIKDWKALYGFIDGVAKQIFDLLEEHQGSKKSYRDVFPIVETKDQLADVVSKINNTTQ